MSFKNIFLNRFIFFIPLLFISFTCCSNQASSEEKFVRLEDFVKGVSSDEQIRLKVKDILIEDISARHLFQNIEYKEPSVWEYYFHKSRKINLIVNNPENLEELRQFFLAKSTNRLTVVLVGESNKENFWRSLPITSSNVRYKKNIEFIVEIPPSPCEEITRIIYKEINSITKKELLKEKETEKKIDLNKIFNLLVNDEIDPYLNGLDKKKKISPCFKTFKLLKLIRGENVSGFESREYRINGELKNLLDSVTDALKDILSDSKKNNLIVKTVGYADPTPVKEQGINIESAATGIDEWVKIGDSLKIHYAECDGNSLKRKTPFYIDFNYEKGKRIEKISNNCELGAVRAYVATFYLLNKLGNDNIKFSYATGGVDFNSDNNQDYAKKRRINIEFIIKTGKDN